jgi:AAA domain
MGGVTPDGWATLCAEDGRDVRVMLSAGWWDLEREPDDTQHVDELKHELLNVGEDLDNFDWDFNVRGLEAAVEQVREAHSRHSDIGLVRDDLPGSILASELRAQPEPEHDWLVPGLERLGGTTIIAGREKESGKSTLIFALTRALERDEATVFGPASSRCVRTVLLTEEPEYSIREKCEDFDLGDGLLIVYNHDVPGTLREKLDAVGRYVEAFKAERFIVDPISRIAGIEDEAGTQLGLAVEPVAALARKLHVSAVVVHHANKAAGATGMDRFRGSTSLTAAADALVLIEKKQPRNKPRSRWLTSWGRVRALNWERVITLGEDNCTYTEEQVVAEDTDSQMLVLMMLKNQLVEVGSSTIAEMLAHQEVEVTTASKARLRKQLDKLVKGGEVKATPGENPTDPYVYTCVSDGQ